MRRAAGEKQITQRAQPQPQPQNRTPGRSEIAERPVFFLLSSKNERFFALCMDKQLEM